MTYKFKFLIYFLLALLITPITFAVTKTHNNTKITDNGLHLYFCGTGTPSHDKSFERHPSCLIAATKNELLMFDAGEGSLFNLQKLKLPIEAISTVFLTHLHSDHIAGLGSIINSSWIFGRKHKLPVYGPYGLEEVLLGFNKVYNLDKWFRTINRDGLLDPAQYGTVTNIIDLDGQTVKPIWHNDELKISASAVKHGPVYPAYGYHIQYKNCRIFITGDTKVFKTESDLFSNTDVVISEALSEPLYTAFLEDIKKNHPEQYEFRKGIIHYHSDTIELSKAAHQAGVKNLFLTHLVPIIGHTDKEKQAFIAGMHDNYKGNMVVADELGEIILHSEGESCDVKYLGPNSD